jgi:hypothetical protein
VEIDPIMTGVREVRSSEGCLPYLYLTGQWRGHKGGTKEDKNRDRLALGGSNNVYKNREKSILVTNIMEWVYLRSQAEQLKC